jgi:hypothetical protein
MSPQQQNILSFWVPIPGIISLLTGEVLSEGAVSRNVRTKKL